MNENEEKSQKSLKKLLTYGWLDGNIIKSPRDTATKNKLEQIWIKYLPGKMNIDN